MDELCNKIFKVMCDLDQQWDSPGVYPIRLLSDMCHLSKYKTTKATHKLRDDGYVKNDCIGRPAVESCGEYRELECEAMPPLHGFSLTERAKETQEYKQAGEEYMRGLAEWANSNFGIGDISNLENNVF